MCSASRPYTQATGTSATPPNRKPSMAPIGPPRTSQSSRRIIQPTPTMEPNAKAKYARARITRRRPDAAWVGWIMLMAIAHAGMLPNADAVFRVEIHLLIGRHGEGGVPRIDVADGGGAILRRCVAVGGNALAQGRLAHLAAPSLAESNE